MPNRVPEEPILRLPIAAATAPLRVSAPRVAEAENKFVELAVVEKILVVVAEVEVEFIAVKFWRVVEALAKILVEVREPEVNVPIVAVLERKSVEEAKPETYKELEVALEEVEFPKTPEPKLKTVAKREVEEAVVEKRLVVVAEVPVAVVKVKLVKAPVGPETLAEVMVELVKLAPSEMRAVIVPRLSASESDCREITGRVSERRISSRRTVVLIIGCNSRMTT